MNTDDRVPAQFVNLVYSPTQWRPGTLLVEGEYNVTSRLSGKRSGRWKLYSLNDAGLSFILDIGNKQYRFSLVPSISSLISTVLGGDAEIKT